MKYTIHVKSGDYEFIETEVEGDTHAAVEAFYELQQAIRGGDGLPQKEFNRFLDCYLKTGKPPEDGMALWEVMNTRQKDIVNECKKALKRTNQ